MSSKCFLGSETHQHSETQRSVGTYTTEKQVLVSKKYRFQDQDFSRVVNMALYELITVLHEIESEQGIEEKEVLNDENHNLEDMHPLVAKATLLAQQVLLVSLEDGGRNYDAENLLEAMSGFKTCMVEDDDSGWVMGGIETAKGIILYA